MSDLCDALGFAVWVALILGLFLLFNGEPDLWDALHEKAMQWAKQGALK